MLHLFSFIVWRTCSYRSCMVARLWVLTRMSAVCWCCCCDAGGSSCGVFGMVERGTGRALAFRVPNSTRETLVTGLVQKFVEPGTTIISDKFSPYFNLNSVGYIHLMVNHSENFVDPYTGAHSNTIEGVWSQIKRKLKAMNGTVKSKLPSYLDEYNWRKCYPGDPFDNLLEAIAEFSPPN